MADVYTPYRKLLAGEDVPIHADCPYPGRYALRRGDQLVPVAIGPDKDGSIGALVDGKPADAAAIWTSCAKRPITQDAYRFRMANGRWPEEPTTAPLSNMPSDPFEALKAEIDDKAAQAEELLTKTPEIKSQTTCDLFRNLQAQLLALNKRADGMHRDEKAPVLEQEHVIDEKFRFRAAVKVLSERLRQRFQSFMAAEEDRLKREAVAKFKAEQDRIAQERARIEAKQAKLMRDDPIAALTSDAPELPELPLAPEPVKITAGGGFGRKAGLKTKRRAQVVDIDAVFHHFKGRQEVHDLLEKLANASLRAGVEVPGTKTVEERVAA